MKESLRSQAAYALFLRSARWTIAIGVFSVLFTLAVMAAVQLGFAQKIPQPILVLPMAVLAIPGAAAGAIIFFGMFAYLVTCDKSSTKAFWIAVFLVATWYGATVYFFKAAAYAPSLPQSWMRCYSVRSCLFDHAPSRGRSSFIQEE